MPRDKNVPFDPIFSEAVRFAEFTPGSSAANRERQKKCLSFFLNPTSETYGRKMASALKAGLSRSTAKNLNHAQWFLRGMGEIGKESANLMEKAERNLKEFIDLDTTEKIVTLNGEVIEVRGKHDKGLLAIKQKTTEFIAKTLGREKYHEKLETENKNLILEVNLNDNELNQRIKELESRIEELEGTNKQSINSKFNEQVLD